MAQLVRQTQHFGFCLVSTYSLCSPLLHIKRLLYPVRREEETKKVGRKKGRKREESQRSDLIEKLNTLSQTIVVSSLGFKMSCRQRPSKETTTNIKIQYCRHVPYESASPAKDYQKTSLTSVIPTSFKEGRVPPCCQMRINAVAFLRHKHHHASPFNLFLPFGVFTRDWIRVPVTRANHPVEPWGKPRPKPKPIGFQ
jgi:hypothetical protein